MKPTYDLDMRLFGNYVQDKTLSYGSLQVNFFQGRRYRKAGGIAGFKNAGFEPQDPVPVNDDCRLVSTSRGRMRNQDGRRKS